MSREKFEPNVMPLVDSDGVIPYDGDSDPNVASGLDSVASDWSSFLKNSSNVDSKDGFR